MKTLLVGFVWLTPAFAFAAESVEFVNKFVQVHQLSSTQAVAVGRLLTSGTSTRNIGTEDPNVLTGPNRSFHMTTRQKCIDKVLKTGLIQQNPEYQKKCGAPWMAPVSSGSCIDQFEFPNMPCEYPMVWTTSAKAKQICEAMGKRVCNSHEWEGACTGRPRSPSSYLFEIADRSARRATINRSREKIYAFQFIEKLNRLTDTRGVCGVYAADDLEMDEPMRANPSQYFAGNGKSLGCDPSTGTSAYKTCGTNSWPSGFKNYCRSSSDVYDLHGNLAEVTSLPETPSQIADGQSHIGGTERKGSFFVYRPDYPDDCLVRQPYEHYGNYATDKMEFYQEGFRCCKDPVN